MRDSSSRLLDKIAFGLAASELIGGSFNSVIEQTKTPEGIVYDIKVVYCRLPNGKVLTISGITTEREVLARHKGILLSSNKCEHLIDLVDGRVSKNQIAKVKNNFKAAIIDNYGSQLK